MRKLFLVAFASLFLVSLATAATCPVIQSKTTSAYLNEIPSISSQLQNCPIQVPSQASSIVKDDNILVTIAMTSGATEQFYLTIKNLQVTAITNGLPLSYSHEVTLSEATLDKILASSDPKNEILAGMKNKEIRIKASTLVGKIKWFFAKFFLPNPTAPSAPATTPAGPTGKPDFCDETWLPGHKEYANNKVLWDGYSSNTDKVCQSQYGKGIPSPCIHSVQLSIEGKPYYLCWYNE